MVDESAKVGAGVDALKPAAGNQTEGSLGTSSFGTTSSNDDQSAQLEALKAELTSLKETVTSLASTARGLATTSFNTMADDAEEVLKRNVFVSVGIAALVGYLWGRSR